jgi:insecticidal toxin complex protein TccC
MTLTLLQELLPPSETRSSRPGAYLALARAWRDGDVLYGLGEPRSVAIAAIREAVAARRAAGDASMGLPSRRRVPIIGQPDLTNAVWDRVSPDRYLEDEEIEDVLADGQRGKDFKAFLVAHPRYDVAGYPRPKNDVAEFANAMWRRTSKGGLEFQLRRGRAVHVVVDRLIESIPDVATKRPTHGTSVTAAELRWLYRHRAMAEVRGLVRFWNEDGPVAQDAIFGKPGWGAYAPSHTYAAGWDKA